MPVLHSYCRGALILPKYTLKCFKCWAKVARVPQRLCLLPHVVGAAVVVAASAAAQFVLQAA